MKQLWLALGLTGLLGLAGCAKVEEHLKPVELVKFEPTAKVDKRWKTSIGSGHDSTYQRFRVALVEGTAYAADEDGDVVALDVKTGKRQWRKSLDLPLGGAVGATERLVLVGTRKGEVIALARADGQEVWRAQVSSSVVTPPQGSASVVVALSNDGRLFAFDADTGKKRWSYDHTMPVLTYRTQSAPVVRGDQVYVGFDNGQLLNFALDDGQLRWNTRVSQPKGRTELDRIVDIDGTPVVDDSFVYCASANGRLVAVNRSTGRIAWAQNTSTLFDIAKLGDAVVVATDEGHVKAYNAASGELLWENKQLHRRGLTAPGVLGNYIAIADFEDYVHLLNAQDGSFAARFSPPGDGFHSPMLTVDDSLLIYSDDGALSAYGLKAP